MYFAAIINRDLVLEAWKSFAVHPQALKWAGENSAACERGLPDWEGCPRVAVIEFDRVTAAHGAYEILGVHYFGPGADEVPVMNVAKREWEEQYGRDFKVKS